jgi:hypothetical protein
MKPLHFLTALSLLLLFSCKKDTIDEIPQNITVLAPVENLIDSLKVVFAENGNALLNNPFLFSDTIQKNIVLSKESDVYVTFIEESTDKQNSLFWYSYLPPQSPINIADIKGNVIFPNISKAGEGGLLEPGSTVQLGNSKFASGTVIGFYIIANGWKDGTINTGKPTYYTDYRFNAGEEQFHVLFKNSYSHYLVMGFEDNINPGRDFNDVLFAVTDNNEGYEAASFDLDKVVVK